MINSSIRSVRFKDFCLFLFCNHCYCSSYSRACFLKRNLTWKSVKEEKNRLTLVGRGVIVIFFPNIPFPLAPCWLYRTPMALLSLVWKLQYSVYMSWSSWEKPFNITTSVFYLKSWICARNKLYKRRIHEDVCGLVVNLCFIQLHCPFTAKFHHL